MFIAALFVISWKTGKTKIQTDVFPWVKDETGISTLWNTIKQKHLLIQKIGMDFIGIMLSEKKPVSKGYYIINTLLTFLNVLFIYFFNL